VKGLLSLRKIKGQAELKVRIAKEVDCKEDYHLKERFRKDLKV